MPASTTRASFWRGARHGSPFILVIVPFSLLFGVVATEAGLNVFETLAFSVVVIAGAAQFTAVQLLVDNAPTAIVLASALAVNLRMAMYSASLTPYLGAAPLWQRALCAYLTVDQSYAVSIARYELEPEMPMPHKVAYFVGTTLFIVPLWYAFTVVGALIGNAIPDSLALDFALPITFLAMVAPMLRTLAHVAAAVVAVVLSLALAGMPYSLGVLVAGAIGMMAGAQVEAAMERRAPR